MIDSRYDLGDAVNIEVKIQRIRTYCDTECEERHSYRRSVRKREKCCLNEYYSKERDVVTGVVQRYVGKNVSINLGKVDAILT